MGLLTKVGKAGDSLRSSCGPHWYLLKSWTSLRLGLATDESRQFQTHPRASPKLTHASRPVLQFNVIKQAGYVPSDIHPLGCSPGEERFVGSSVRSFGFFRQRQALVRSPRSQAWECDLGEGALRTEGASAGAEPLGAATHGPLRGTKHSFAEKCVPKRSLGTRSEHSTLNFQHSTFLLDSPMNPQHLWIAMRDDSPNHDAATGSENDPFDGSTSAKFDILMQRLAHLQDADPSHPGWHLHLAPAPIARWVCAAPAPRRFPTVRWAGIWAPAGGSPAPARRPPPCKSRNGRPSSPAPRPVPIRAGPSLAPSHPSRMCSLSILLSMAAGALCRADPRRRHSAPSHTWRCMASSAMPAAW